PRRPPPGTPLFPYTTLFRSKPRGKADGVACGTRRSEAGIDRLGVLWQVDKVPALDGLHDDDGLVVLSAHFIALSGLNSGILVVRSEEHTSELQSRFDLVCRL